MAALSAERYLAASGLNLQDYHQSPAVRACAIVLLKVGTSIVAWHSTDCCAQEHRDEAKPPEVQELTLEGELDMHATRHRGQYGMQARQCTCTVVQSLGRQMNRRADSCSFVFCSTSEVIP